MAADVAGAVTAGLYGAVFVKAFGLDRSRVAVVAYQRGKAGEFSEAWQALRRVGPDALGPVRDALRAEGFRKALSAVRSTPQHVAHDLKPLGRQLNLAVDLLRGPTMNNIPVSGGVVNLPLPGRPTPLPVHDAWGKVHRASGGMAAALAGLTLVAATANLTAGVQAEGSDGLLGTRHGRTGLALTGAAAAEVALHSLAAVNRDAGQGVMQGFFGSSWHAKTAVRTARYGVQALFGLAMTYNLAGGFDRLNVRTA